MRGRGRMRWIGIAAGAFLTASAPLTVSTEGLRPQAAECQSGTCCPEDRATCVIGNNQVGGYYHKSEGSCHNVT